MNGHSVLIVDDNELDASLVRYLLDAFGYRTLVATSGAESLDVALRERPELVLMDIVMSGMDGYDTLRAMRGERTLDGSRIVALTILGSAAERQDALAAGFDGHIAKPVLATQFEAQIAAVLGQTARDDGDGTSAAGA